MHGAYEQRGPPAWPATESTSKKTRPAGGSLQEQKVNVPMSKQSPLSKIKLQRRFTTTSHWYSNDSRVPVIVNDWSTREYQKKEAEMTWVLGPEYSRVYLVLEYQKLKWLSTRTWSIKKWLSTREYLECTNRWNDRVLASTCWSTKYQMLK